jgi:hypothetical protein
MKRFNESTTAPVKAGNNWRAILITPGQGSSGFYSESMLREFGPTAFPKGTHSYVDHPKDESDGRSPKNLMAVLAEDAHYVDGVGLVAELAVMEHWKEFVEAVAPYTGLSIWASGEGVHDDEGNLVVESLTANTQNSVDMVSYPGRAGSGLAQKLYESAISMQVSSEGAETPMVEEASINEEEGIPVMTIEELSAQIAGLPALIAAAVVDALNSNPDENSDNQSSNDMQVAQSADVNIADVAEAMLAAGLPEVSRKAVYESIRNGGDFAVAIEGQKAFVEAVESHLKESAAVVAVESEATLLVTTSEKAASLADILKIKVGA